MCSALLGRDCCHPGILSFKLNLLASMRLDYLRSHLYTLLYQRYATGNVSPLSVILPCHLKISLCFMPTRFATQWIHLEDEPPFFVAGAGTRAKPEVSFGPLKKKHRSTAALAHPASEVGSLPRLEHPTTISPPARGRCARLPLFVLKEVVLPVLWGLFQSREKSFGALGIMLQNCRRPGGGAGARVAVGDCGGLLDRTHRPDSGIEPMGEAIKLSRPEGFRVLGF